MSIRERSELIEFQVLSERAAKSSRTLGRRVQEAPCDIRNEFQRDRDRIIHSKSFRRLKHKTQVFLSPEGDHYRTRLTHTLEVAQISRTVARALRLNEDLTEAIALGHDLGHTPFGHCGEAELNRIHPSGFVHNEQSLRVVDLLERREHHQHGLNLTYEVRDGILHHRGSGIPITLEGQIVKISDRIAYINHDIDDAVRAGVLRSEQIPGSFFHTLGSTHSDRINFLIVNLIEHSVGAEYIQFSDPVANTFNDLRTFMFERVYLNLDAKKEEMKAMGVVRALYEYFKTHPEKMPFEQYQAYQNGDGEIAVKDFIAGMTDRYAVQLYRDLFVPNFWI